MSVHFVTDDATGTDPARSEPDWASIARRYNAALARMVHDEKTDLHGDAFYAEAMRRAVAGEHSLITRAEAERIATDTARVAAFNADTWERRHNALRDDLRALEQSTARTRLAEAAIALRSVATHTMTKYRREGWEQAIEALWPARLGDPEDALKARGQS